MIDPIQLADTVYAAQASGDWIATPPSAQDPAFDLRAAYAVEAAYVRRRRAAGRRTTGLKVGFANKAIWRALKLETLAWAHMFDDTVMDASSGIASLSLDILRAPKIEPEIVFTLGKPVEHVVDATAALNAVESLALGFEIIDCPYPNWTFQPVDFVAAGGFHTRLFVGPPQRVEPAIVPTLVESLARFTVRLTRNGETVEEGAGRNVLRSPALCLAELVTAMARRPDAEQLAPGDRVSTGTLTESRLIGPGETWAATVEGLDLPTLTLHVTA